MSSSKYGEKHSRVTSVEFDAGDFNYVAELISQGKVRSLKEFVEMCVKFGRAYTLDKWEPGIFNVGPVRVVLVAKKMLDMLVQRIPEEDYVNVGRELGEVVESFALLKGLNTKDPKNRAEALQILSNFGFGLFTQKQEEIQVTHPTFPYEITQALIEQTLGVELEAMRTLLDVQFFKRSK